METLQKFVKPKELRKEAEFNVYQRGVKYYKQERVVIREIDDRVVSAQVLGTKSYYVQRWIDEFGLFAECT